MWSAVIIGLLLASFPGAHAARPPVEASLSREKQTLRSPRKLSLDVTLDGETFTAEIAAGATAHEAANVLRKANVVLGAIPLLPDNVPRVTDAGWRDEHIMRS